MEAGDGRAGFAPASPSSRRTFSQAPSTIHPGYFLTEHSMSNIQHDANAKEAAGLPNGSAERRERIEIRPVKLNVDEPIIKGMVGRSAHMTKLAADIMRVARFDYDVLITGANGTGKSIAAKAIHEASARAKRSFVTVNAATLPRDLIEKLLFGNEPGAFSGARDQQKGYFEAANGGTLFLDEIGELPLDLQAKLLTVLDDKKFMRVGGTEAVSCDVRIIAATKRNLERMVEAGEFREDLYYRLRFLRVKVPSLDERREDIPALALHALGEHAARVKRAEPYTISDDGIAALLERAWPGSIRELQFSIIEVASHLEETRSMITAADIESVLGRNLFEVGERDGDAKTVLVGPYIVGEELDHFLDRTLITLSNTLLEHTKSSKRVAQILNVTDARVLNQRLDRAEARLKAASANANLFVKRLRLRNTGSDS
jgi:transcriptional regulator with PAS, ATPase and Fis domain